MSFDDDSHDKKASSPPPAPHSTKDRLKAPLPSGAEIPGVPEGDFSPRAASVPIPPVTRFDILSEEGYLEESFVVDPDGSIRLTIGGETLPAEQAIRLARSVLDAARVAHRGADTGRLTFSEEQEIWPG